MIKLVNKDIKIVILITFHIFKKFEHVKWRHGRYKQDQNQTSRDDTICEMKHSLDEIKNRLDSTEKKIHELEKKAIQSFQNETQKE